MEALKKVFSPGHNVDDELMYGSGDTKKPTNNSKNTTSQASELGSSSTGDTTAQPTGTATSGLTPPSQAYNKDDASTASIKSGVVGQDTTQDSTLTPDTANTSRGAGYSNEPAYPAGAQSKDFATSNKADPRVESDLSQARATDTMAAGQPSTFGSHPAHTGHSSSRAAESESSDSATYGQTSTYSSFPARIGDSTSHAVDSESREPTSYGQSNTYSSLPIRGGDSSSRAADRESNDGVMYGKTGNYSSWPLRESDNTSRAAEAGSRDPTAYGQTGNYSSYPSQTGDSSSHPRDYQSTNPTSQGQPSIYASYPSQTGDNTSRAIQPESRESTAYGQPEKMSTDYSAGVGAGVGAGAAQVAGGQAWTRSSDRTASDNPEQGLSGRGSVPRRQEGEYDSPRAMPGQYPQARSDNPYTSSHLDPRVDPHAQSSSGGNTSAPGTVVTTTTESGNQFGGYDYSRGSQGLSSAKTTAEPFAGPKGTSESFAGPKGTSEPFAGPKGTSESFAGPKGTSEPFAGPKGTSESFAGAKEISEPLQKEDQHKNRSAKVMGAVGLGGLAAKSQSRDREPKSSISPTTTSKAEASQSAYSDAGKSDPTASAEDTHKERKGGLLGALGLKGHGDKKHADDKPDPLTTESKRGPVSIISQKPTTSYGDERYSGGLTSESGAGARDTAAPAEDSHKERKGGLLGSLGLKGRGDKKHVNDESDLPATESRREPVPITSHDPSMIYGDERHRGEPTRGFATDSGVKGSNASARPDDTHKERKGGLLGALGLKDHGDKKHVDDKHDAPTTESGREPMAATSRPPDTSFGDERHPGTKGGFIASPSGGHRDASTPSPAAYSQPSGQSPSTPAYRDADRPNESHTSRNVAVGGAAAAGAGALGAHDYSKRQAEKEEQDRLAADAAHQKAVEDSRRAAEKERKAHDKALVKEKEKAEKEHEKAVKKDEKQAEKEEKKAEKEHEKTVKKEEKKAEKEHEKAEKEHQKAIIKEEKKAEKEHEKAVHAQEKEHEKAIITQEKEREKAIHALEKEQEKAHEKAVKLEEKKEKEHDKELAKQEKEAEKRKDSEDSGKKKGGIIGLFKRRRDSLGNEIDDEEDSHTGAKTTASVGAASTGAQEAGKHHEHGKHHEMNKLHKDPPPGYGYTGDSSTPAYADYAVKENDHPGAQTVAGGYTAPAPEHDSNKYAGTGSMIDRPRGATYDDATPSRREGREADNIVLHSDGKRHYVDGSLVDPEDTTGNESAKHKHEGSKVEKVLEKLHLRKKSQDGTGTGTGYEGSGAETGAGAGAGKEHGGTKAMQGMSS